MKTSVAAIMSVLVVLALALLFLGGPDREFTTSSSEAYRLYEQGVDQLYSVQRPQAVASFTEAVELDPDFAMAWAMLGNAQATILPDEVERIAAIADSLAGRLPNDLERAKVQLVVSGLKGPGGHDGDSLIAFILAEQPDDLLANIAKATTLFFKRDDSAADAFHHVLEIEPNHAMAYNMLGYLEANRGNYDAALENLRKYAFMAPDLANPHDSLGEVLSWMGRYAEAEKEFLTALKLQPDFHYSLVNLGEVYMHRGQLVKGLEILEGVREQVAGTRLERDIDEFLIRTYYEFDLSDASLAAIDAYVERTPDTTSAQYFKAIAAFMRGDEEACQEHLDAFRAKLGENSDPENEEVQRYLQRMEHQFAAIAASARGDHETAAAEWGAMLALIERAAPHELWFVLWRQGESYLASGHPREALDNAFAILEINPRLIRPLLLMARAALDVGEPEIARKAIRRLQKIMPEADPDLPAQQTYRQLLSEIASPASS
ncbi:tetratricopeptide repeat protein [bacterium]|nr:tetratricopeptide repeat protein [bacterium]MBU1072344.1 tetratricopeptide repeat protein [bacterium]MBU1676807.1 tetratricopeptide repeat protein [bacterium]